MQRILQGARRSRKMKRMQRTEANLMRRRRDEKEWEQRDKEIKKMEQGYLKEEVRNRREDWMLGPLAPNRNSGANRNVIGTVNNYIANRPALPKGWVPKITPGYQHIGPEARVFEPNTMTGNVVVNDRVCIVHGPERLLGLVGTVTDVSNETGMLKLRDINMANIEVPVSVHLTSPDASADVEIGHFQTQELPIPIESTRLVVDMPTYNPETGEEGDVEPCIVRHVHAGRPYELQETTSNRPAHTRYITGSETFSENGQPIQIPWPDREDKDHVPIATEADTKETLVGDKTWTPDLRYSPLGYRQTIDSKQQEATSAYDAGLPPEHLEDLDNIVRAGLHGFIHEPKLYARNRRVANGIMNELAGHRPSKHRNLEIDFNELRATKILEDARSIWWQERAKDLQKTSVSLAIRQEMLKRGEEAGKQIQKEKQSMFGTRKKDDKTEVVGKVEDVEGHTSLDDMIKNVNSQTIQKAASVKNAASESKTYEFQQALNSLPKAVPFKMDVHLRRKVARQPKARKKLDRETDAQ